MPRKWEGPLDPPPAYLDPTLEVTEENDTAKPPIAVFILTLIEYLLRRGCTLPQAFSVVANVISEAGWHLSYRGNNPFGWKITEEIALAYQALHGKKHRWYRAAGNLDSGDPNTCFYRAFDALVPEAIEAWLKRFVPNPAEVAPPPAKGKDPLRYRAAGAAFWAGRPWFACIIDKGYKGPVTQNDPVKREKSIAAHEVLTVEMSEWWAQGRLQQLITNPLELGEFSIDGKWGIRSAALCRAFQKQHGLTPTGNLDTNTLDALAKYTRPAV